MNCLICKNTCFLQFSFCSDCIPDIIGLSSEENTRQSKLFEEKCKMLNQCIERQIDYFTNDRGNLRDLKKVKQIIEETMYYKYLNLPFENDEKSKVQILKTKINDKIFFEYSCKGTPIFLKCFDDDYSIVETEEYSFRSFLFNDRFVFSFHYNDQVIFDSEYLVFSQPSLKALILIFFKKMNYSGDVKNIDWNALKKAYHLCAKKTHPDKQQNDSTLFLEIKEMYESLKELKELNTKKEKWIWYTSNVQKYIKIIPETRILTKKQEDELKLETINAKLNPNIHIIDLLKECITLQQNLPLQEVVDVEKKYVLDYLKSGLIFLYSPMRKKRVFKNSKLFYHAFFVPYFMKKNIKAWFEQLPEDVKNYLEKHEFNEDLLYGRMKYTIAPKKKGFLIEYIKSNFKLCKR